MPKTGAETCRARACALGDFPQAIIFGAGYRSVFDYRGQKLEGGSLSCSGAIVVADSYNYVSDSRD